MNIRDINYMAFTYTYEAIILYLFVNNLPALLQLHRHRVLTAIIQMNFNIIASSLEIENMIMIELY